MFLNRFVKIDEKISRTLIHRPALSVGRLNYFLQITIFFCLSDQHYRCAIDYKLNFNKDLIKFHVEKLFNIMISFLKNELLSLKNHTKTLDKKVVIIFLSIAILQTISWYVTSRKFFRTNLFEQYQFHSQVYLIEYLYWFIGDFITFFILPLLIIHFIFKEKSSSYGLQVGDHKTGLKITIIFILIMLPIVWFASASSSFADVYPHLPSARESWAIFFTYELGLIVYMIAWEFVWRGYMLFGLYEKFGFYSIFIQMIPFAILHNGKPMLETFGSILAGLALGFLALRTKSIFYCVFAHMSVMFSLDLISTLRFRSEEFGVGFSSLVNIFKNLLL